MRRREFITLLGGAAAWPLAARAQQPAMPTIGYLDSRSPEAVADRLRGLRQGLKESGYIENESVVIAYRWAENQPHRLQELAADLVRRGVAAIVTAGPPATFAAKAATTTIPILFLVGDDPVRLGLVASLARPGGNMTGINIFNVELAAKRLELLRELVPRAARIALLVNPADVAITESQVKEVQAAARAIGLQIQVFNADSSPEIDAAFETIGRERPDAMFVGVSPFLNGRRVQLAQLAAFHRLPAIYAVRLRGSRWADELRIGRCRWVSSSWGLRRSHPQGREACGFAGRAVEQVRARHQRLDRPDARPHCAGQVAGCRRRGGRIRDYLAAIAHSRLWHFSAVPTTPSNVRFQG
jgi:putative tryptophan/tyrosine transport system substrate-binding protein